MVLGKTYVWFALIMDYMLFFVFDVDDGIFFSIKCGQRISLCRSLLSHCSLNRSAIRKIKCHRRIDNVVNRKQNVCE